MGTNDRKATGACAASVQSLKIPDWVREAIAGMDPAPPAGALSICELSRMFGKSRSHTNEIVKKLYNSGLVDRVKFRGKYLYLEKAKKK